MQPSLKSPALLGRYACRPGYFPSTCRIITIGPYWNSRTQCRATSTGASTPEQLRILFCGSDHFSVPSLKALHREHLSNSGLIRSIDVLCQEDKRSGRGMKTIREAPIKSLAKSLAIRLHEIHKFEDWKLPDNAVGEKINLLVAVSFGLFIPRRVIGAAKYGGLNVHPSLLPMYRGAAPIYHTLLDQQPITGVTVQTLHPAKFDYGVILLQTNPPIEVPPRTRYQALHDTLAIHGAELLMETIHRGLFIPPISPVENDYKPSLASKINPDHARIEWKSHDAEEVERRCGALDTVWCRISTIEEPELERRKRVIFSDVSVFDYPEELSNGEEIEPGNFEYISWRNGYVRCETLIVKCRKGGGWISVGGIKIEGKQLVHAGEWARSIAAQKGKVGKKIFT